MPKIVTSRSVGGSTTTSTTASTSSAGGSPSSAFDAKAEIGALKTKVSDLSGNLSGVSSSYKRADTVSDARELDQPDPNTALVVASKTTAGDGGGGLFIWDAASTEADDGGTILAIAGVATGRWKRLPSIAYDVKWFGLKGDGSTNDTTALNAMISAIPAGSEVFFPAGSYVLTDTVNVTKALRFRMVEGAKIIPRLANNHSTGELFAVTASKVIFDGMIFDGSTESAVYTTTGNRYMIRFKGTSVARLSNCKVLNNCRFIDCKWGVQPTPPSIIATHCVYATFCDDLRVEDSDFLAPTGAAIFLVSCTRPVVRGNYINDTGWYSVQLQQSNEGARVLDNTISGDTPGVRYWGGSINVMGNAVSGSDKRIQIRGNIISGVHSYGGGCVYLQSAHHVDIDGNTFINCSGSNPNLFEPISYVRIRSRNFNPPPTNHGPSLDINIRGNLFIAGAAAAIAVYVDVPDGGTGSIDRMYGLTVTDNKITAPHDNKTSTNTAGCTTAIVSAGSGAPAVTIDGTPVRYDTTSAFGTSPPAMSQAIGGLHGTEVTGLVIKVTQGGVPNVALGNVKIKWSLDGGLTYSAVTDVPTSGSVVLGSSGLTAILTAASTYTNDNVYIAAAPVSKLLVQMVTGGARGTATFKWSPNNGQVWYGNGGKIFSDTVDTEFTNVGVTTAATVALPNVGFTLSFATGTYSTSHSYSCTAQYFGGGVLLHGQQGGISAVTIANNHIVGVPFGYGVGGLVGGDALGTTQNISGVKIIGNDIRMQGTKISSKHIGIWVGTYTDKYIIDSNVIDGFTYGIRTSTNVTLLRVGNSNHFSNNTNNMTFSTSLPASGRLAPATNPVAWAPGSVAAGATVSTTVTVTGAVPGDLVLASYSVALADGLIFLPPYVSATNTVTCKILNATAGPLDPADGNLTVFVEKVPQ